jgi:signal transduction histidine kinase
MTGGQVTLNREHVEPFFIVGDRAALSRALSNIIGNALRYGCVAHVTVRSQGGMAEIIVDDEGQGVPPSQREAVFRAFHRAESSRNRSTGGTGLGLAIALNIVERQHHGSIVIASAPGGGARFRIRLPRINDDKRSAE